MLRKYNISYSVLSLEVLIQESSGGAMAYSFSQSNIYLNLDMTVLY